MSQVTHDGAAPRISVALCTYNGARHLAEQLGSIAAQTRRPDEIVISDDGSTDATAELVADFARQADLPVHFHRQAVNLGVTQNFAFALAACRGDLIALSDQDDVWLPDKLARSVRFFEEHPRCLAHFSDVVVVDEALEPLAGRSSLWAHLGLTAEDRRRLPDPEQGLVTLAGRFLVTGATVVLRRELLAHALPIPAELPFKVIHDGWIALVAAALGGLDSLPEPTLLYRQHSHQQLGVRPGPPSPFAPSVVRARGEYLLLAERLEEIHRALATRFSLGQGAGALAALGDRAAFFRWRAELPGPRRQRLGPVIRRLTDGSYRRYCRRTLRAALRDLLF